MAKKRKAKNSKKDQPPKQNSFWQGVGAVFLIVAGIVLAFGSFIDAPLPQGFWNGTWDLFGAATVIIPFALVYLGALKFTSEDGQIPLAQGAGRMGLVIFLASWFETAFNHGGSVGDSIGSALEGALGQFLASLIFFLLAV